MVQILERNPTGLSATLESVNQGLGGALQGLLNNKIQQIQSQQDNLKKAQLFADLKNSNLPDDVAGLISNFHNSPQTVQKLLDSVWQRGGAQDSMMQGGQQPNMQQMMGGMQQPSAMDQVQQEQSNRLMQGLSPDMQAALGPQIQQPQKQSVWSQPPVKGQLERDKLQLSKQKQNFAEQQKITPFLHSESEDYKAEQKAGSIAKRMLKIIDKYGNKFPGAIVGNLPVAIQNIVNRDPKLRKYVADANELVIAKGQTRKGVPTNFKLKLEQLAKADLGQPLQTQREILEGIVSDSQKSSQRQKYIESQKTSSGYPLDIERKVIEYDMASQDPLKYPEFFNNGQRYEDDDQVIWVLKNGKWVKE